MLTYMDLTGPDGAVQLLNTAGSRKETIQPTC